MRTIDWNELDWGTAIDFDKPFERDESLDLSELDFENYIWLRFFEDVVLTVGDADGFWQMCEEEQDYATPKEWLDSMVSGDMFCKVPRNAKGYQRVEWE